MKSCCPEQELPKHHHHLCIRGNNLEGTPVLAHRLVILGSTSNRISCWIFFWCGIMLCSCSFLGSWQALLSIPADDDLTSVIHIFTNIEHELQAWTRIALCLQSFYYNKILQCIQQHRLSEADSSIANQCILQLGWHQTTIWYHLEAAGLP